MSTNYGPRVHEIERDKQAHKKIRLWRQHFYRFLSDQDAKVLSEYEAHFKQHQVYPRRDTYGIVQDMLKAARKNCEKKAAKLALQMGLQPYQQVGPRKRRQGLEGGCWRYSKRGELRC